MGEGTIALEGDLIQTKNNKYSSLFAIGSHLIFAGEKEQKVQLEDPIGTPLYHLDLTGSAGVNFTEGTLSTKRQKGRDKIQNEVQILYL